MPRGVKRYDRITSEVFASVIKAFLASAKFQSLGQSAQTAYRRLLMLAEHRDSLGSVSVDEMRPALVQAFLDGLADRPATQKNALIAIKSLERWAVVRDLLPRPISTGCEAPGSDGGHVPWTEDMVVLAEEKSVSHLSRALSLAANTGQRGSDLVKMRWTDIEDVEGRPGINVTQQKTGLKIWIPFTQPLIAKMATWERRPGFILTKADGHPFTRHQLSNHWLVERDSNPALAPLREAKLVIHGLRGTAVVRLRRAGATTPQICDMVGMSPQMVKRYSRYSDQRENALAAVHVLDRTRDEKRKLK